MSHPTQDQQRRRHAVVSGASIAGLSTAWWLRRTGWDVTVIERAPAFRDGGQNVDVRGTGHEVLERMGLVEAVRAQHTTETGTVLVDASGTVVAELPSDGPDASTAELEILRGDFARAILDRLPAGVDVRYGDPIAAVDDGVDAVTVVTTAGETLRADLLVIAEGVRSTTRDLVFADVAEPRALGITMVFGTIPRTADDDTRWRWYTADGGRQVHLRPDNHGTTRAILGYAEDDDDLIGLDRGAALARLRERFADAGWQAPRVLDAFETSDDVYVDQLTQMHVGTWHRGRVCLAGDAGWSVTPLGGGGATLALTAGFVLAAALSTAGPDGHERALAAYEEWMRPLVDGVQKLPPGLRHMAFPQTSFGVRVHDAFAKVLTSRPLATVTARIPQVARSERELPDIVLTA